MASRQIPGLALAVTINGRLVYSKGFGNAIVETETSFKSSTRCRIGSISKGLTAIGVAVLLERGLLLLDDPVVPTIDKFLAKKAATIDSRWNQITVRHCLTLRTGITDETAGEQARIAKELDIAFPPRGKAILEWRSKRPLQLDPGAKFVYNSYGHYLLARVIEAKSNLTYRAFMKKYVFDKVPAPSFELSEGQLKNLYPDECHYYSKATPAISMWPDSKVKEDYSYYYDPQTGDGAGCWIATASDLAKTMWAYGAGKIVTLKTLNLMFGIEPKGESLNCATGKGPNGEVQVFNGVGAVLYGAHAFAEWKGPMTMAFVCNSGMNKPGQDENAPEFMKILDLEDVITKIVLG
jgi:CubicO group peptidase (beta-lactamase class C family)